MGCLSRRWFFSLGGWVLLGLQSQQAQETVLKLMILDKTNRLALSNGHERGGHPHKPRWQKKRLTPLLQEGRGSCFRPRYAFFVPCQLSQLRHELIEMMIGHFVK